MPSVTLQRGLDIVTARSGPVGRTNVERVDGEVSRLAEVQDGQRQIVLVGRFTIADEEDEDDVEWKPALKPARKDADPAGEAEVEFAKSTSAAGD